MIRQALALAVVVLAGCSSKPDPMSVCKQIEAAGIGKNCHDGTPAMMSMRAAKVVELDLTHVAGKTAAVMSFAKADDYTATVKAFEAVAALAGPHRYGSEKALIFVQLNSGLSAADGDKVKGLVSNL